jgi:purine-cytosine permease-like protein
VNLPPTSRVLWFQRAVAAVLDSLILMLYLLLPWMALNLVDFLLRQAQALRERQAIDAAAASAGTAAGAAG